MPPGRQLRRHGPGGSASAGQPGRFKAGVGYRRARPSVLRGGLADDHAAQVRAAVWQAHRRGARDHLLQPLASAGPTRPSTPPRRTDPTRRTHRSGHRHRHEPRDRIARSVLNSPTVTSGWSHGRRHDRDGEVGDSREGKTAKAKKKCRSKNGKTKKKCKKKAKGKARAAKAKKRCKSKKGKKKKEGQRASTCSPARRERRSRAGSRCPASVTQRPRRGRGPHGSGPQRLFQRPLRRRRRDSHLPHRRYPSCDLGRGA